MFCYVCFIFFTPRNKVFTPMQINDRTPEKSDLDFFFHIFLTLLSLYPERRIWDEKKKFNQALNHPLQSSLCWPTLGNQYLFCSVSAHLQGWSGIHCTGYGILNSSQVVVQTSSRMPVGNIIFDACPSKTTKSWIFEGAQQSCKFKATIRKTETWTNPQKR